MRGEDKAELGGRCLSPDFLPGKEMMISCVAGDIGDGKTAYGKLQLALVSDTFWVALVFSPNAITGDPGTSIHPLLKTRGIGAVTRASMNPVNFCHQT